MSNGRMICGCLISKAEKEISQSILRYKIFLERLQRITKQEFC